MTKEGTHQPKLSKAELVSLNEELYQLLEVSQQIIERQHNILVANGIDPKTGDKPAIVLP